MTRVSEKEIEAVLKLDGEGRFRRFIKTVVDRQQAWGLWDDGWALLQDDAGARVLPLWPAEDYAELCRIHEWTSYVPTAIALDDLCNELLPKLRSQGVLAGVFPTPTGRGVTPDLDTLEAALREESEQYEQPNAAAGTGSARTLGQVLCPGPGTSGGPRSPKV